VASLGSGVVLLPDVLLGVLLVPYCDEDVEFGALLLP
jgi:hypothetical protein